MAFQAREHSASLEQHSRKNEPVIWAEHIELTPSNPKAVVRFAGTKDVKEFDVFSPRRVMIGESPRFRPKSSIRKQQPIDSEENI